ncbi:hypothetical protein PIB30_083385 [Stylosanthes scabra]|uniref:Uncharacterized protein n=1 Tax=Stylosanthes scabra TaxID=79078 RepID=A0ABU6XU41_9FABA|nr:hypothetical protein [Stylosanthes scabra]
MGTTEMCLDAQWCKGTTYVNVELGLQAKFGAEVAKESARNEKIAKKSLKAKSRAYVNAPSLCIRITMPWASHPSLNRTICICT